MAKLFDALPENARVILLGDRHQLASVDPGFVLGDIAGASSDPASLLHGSLVTLRKNYRFGEKSGIFELSLAIREGNSSRALEILAACPPGVTQDKTPPPSLLAESLRSRVIAGFSACLRESDPAKALAELQKFRVLCALRSGPYGVENINRIIAQVLRDEGLITTGRHYAGQPVLITQNDYELRLFNGDIGILARGPADSHHDSLSACFLDEAGAVRHIPPARLPAWETAFAMTVHKSQGSEYDNVLLLLPDRESPVLTRELVYTGLTRARNGVEIWFLDSVLGAAIAKRARRSSGLREKLGSVVREKNEKRSQIR